MRSWDSAPDPAETVPCACLGKHRSLYPEGAGGLTGGVHRGGLSVFANGALAFGAQNLTQVSINFYGVLRSLVDHLDPSAQVFGRDRLRNQVGGLHDGLKRVAEIVRQSAEFLGQFSRDFI